ncbi:flagellar biosynthetic protein FliQ [Pseudoxanthomonas sp. PXM02]|uniref:flagellar biosynthetic protein FliQ n=1 Tax=Pseudoxanthomonas sp. PXM02 TaxID=2769294 RepID=UPI00177CB27B|nr:flagellar biosynthetic protein FliQ [Pseudoxanthomonas sp. PXM02]MBD9477434.1 flagellar biosynthetic protein FliQ [Pseudoxanthomonas sp. PXM02]
MDADTAMHLLSETLLAAAKVAAPILLVTLVVGLVISILQVVTQVQEMTLTFIPKLIAVGVVSLMLGGWMIATTVELAKRLFEFAAGL